MEEKQVGKFYKNVYTEFDIHSKIIRKIIFSECCTKYN